MPHEKFHPHHLERLNDPARLESLDPARMWAALGEPDPAIIVDVGAGTGVFSAAFARLALDATVYAVDTEQTMIDWMRENRPEVAAGRIALVHAEESKIPLPDDFAGLVTMINIHHELADPDASYEEVFRLTKPGGQLLVVDYGPGDSPSGPPQEVRVSAEVLEEFIERAGFVEVSSHPGLLWASMLTAERPD